MTGQPDPITAATAYGVAVGRRDVDAAVALFAPGGSIVPGNIPGLPFGGVATGSDAIKEFLRGQFEHMDIISTDIHTITTGPRDLIAAATITARFLATGHSFTTDAALHFTIDDHGRIVRYQIHEDTHAIAQALTQPSKAQEIDAWTDDLHQSLRDRNVEAMAARWAEDITYRAPGLQLSGIAARMAAEQPILEAFSECDVIVHERWHDGDTIIEHCALRGRHTGPIDTEIGRIEPTGTMIDLEYVQLLCWADGKVVDQIISYDRAGLITQLTSPGENQDRQVVIGTF